MPLHSDQASSNCGWTLNAICRHETRQMLQIRLNIMVARFGSIAKLYKQLYDWTIDLWQWSSLLPCQELSAPSWVLVQPQWGLCNRLRAVVAGFSWPVLSTNVNLWHDLSCQVPTNQGRSRVDLPLEDCRSYIPEIKVFQRFDSLLTLTRQMLAEHLGRQFVLDWQPLPGCNCCWTGWKSPLKELTEKGINFTALPPLSDLIWRGGLYISLVSCHWSVSTLNSNATFSLSSAPVVFKLTTHCSLSM